MSGTRILADLWSVLKTFLTDSAFRIIRKLQIESGERLILTCEYIKDDLGAARDVTRFETGNLVEPGK